jgi:hypothetical protein
MKKKNCSKGRRNKSYGQNGSERRKKNDEEKESSTAAMNSSNHRARAQS